MSERPEANRWVWRSTEASRAAGQVSVLAIAETLVCVALYWLLLLWLGVTWHHWMILIATPLVLLRSKQSLVLGVKWFEEYLENPTDISLRSIKDIGIVITSFLLSGLACMFLTNHWLAGEIGWVLIAKIMLVVGLGAALAIAIGVAHNHGASGSGLLFSLGAIAGLIAVSTFLSDAVYLIVDTIFSRIFYIILSFTIVLLYLLLIIVSGSIIGFALRVFCIRIRATFLFLLVGLSQFSRNWRYSTLTSDVFHAPELIPGTVLFAYGHEISLYWRDKDGSKKILNEYLLSIVMIPVFYGPTILWRWAIKSTAWFYLPLLWVRRGWQRLDGEDLQVWAKSYSSKVVNWIWLLSGLISIATVTLTLFSLEKYLTLQRQLEPEGAPTTVLGFFLSLDWSELLTLPWLWFYIPSYILTVAIFFALDGIAKDIRNGGADPATRAAQMSKWMWAANARAVLTNIGLGIALLYFLDAVEAWGQVKALVQSLL